MSSGRREHPLVSRVGCVGNVSLRDDVAVRWDGLVLVEGLVNPIALLRVVGRRTLMALTTTFTMTLSWYLRRWFLEFSAISRRRPMASESDESCDVESSRS